MKSKTVEEVRNKSYGGLTHSIFTEAVYIPAIKQGVTELICTDDEFSMAVISAAHANQYTYCLQDGGDPYVRGFGIILKNDGR